MPKRYLKAAYNVWKVAQHQQYVQIRNASGEEKSHQLIYLECTKDDRDLLFNSDLSFINLTDYINVIIFHSLK